ncbi:MAG: hypothetical protein ACI934_001411 [Pseudohongiellaceae bacterium]|jgi:hypothetical protein
MKIEGGCYCGNIRYAIDGDFVFKGECCCRECQYISGGNPNVVVGVPEALYSYTKGEPKQHTRADLDNPVTREFCADCGTHIATRAPGAPGIAIVKVGTLDEPALFDKPDRIIWTSEMQPFHQLPDGVPTFPGFAVHD